MMQKLLHELCLHACSFTSFTIHCYFLYTVPATFMEVYSASIALSGNLNENKIMYNKINYSYVIPENNYLLLLFLWFHSNYIYSTMWNIVDYFSDLL